MLSGCSLGAGHAPIYNSHTGNRAKMMVEVILWSLVIVDLPESALHNYLVPVVCSM